MRLLLTTLAPLTHDLSHAPRPVRALADFRAAGHDLFVAAPLADDAEQLRAAWGVRGVLPLLPTPPTAWGRLALNAYRVANWARQWRPHLYLSLGARAATLAHGGRGTTGGFGLSVLVLPALRYERGCVGRWLEHRALRECDRLVVYDATLAESLVAHHGARGGDLTLLPGQDPSPFVPLCEQYLAEPPGFY